MLAIKWFKSLPMFVLFIGENTFEQGMIARLINGDSNAVRYK